MLIVLIQMIVTQCFPVVLIVNVRMILV